MHHTHTLLPQLALSLCLLPLSVLGCTCSDADDSTKQPPGPQGDDTGLVHDGGADDDGGEPSDTAPPLPTHAERVFIIVLDGVRSSESILPMDPQAPDPMDTGAVGSDTDPETWSAQLETLLEHSVLVPVLENRDPTTTEAAHRTMVTGRRQPVGNYPWYEDRVLQRSFTPTIFEAAASQLDPGGSIVHGNTVFMDSQGTSLYPANPGAWVPNEATTLELAYGEDPAVVADFLELLDEDDRVVLLNLHQADKDAHGGDWASYVDNANKEGRTVLRLADQIGKETDAFVVLADHGRHLDPNYFGHGDGCQGCRSSWLLAFGAGVRDDLDQVTQIYELADVAPTVATLLGIDLPTARGRVISELLAAPPDPRQDALVDPDIAIADSGIHRVAELLPGGADELAEGALLYQRSTDGGATWTDEIFAQAEYPYTTPEEPQILADGDTVVRLWRAYSREALIWQVLAQHSADGGQSWSAAQVVADEVLHSATPAAVLDPSVGLVLSVHSTQADGVTNGPTGFNWSQGAVGEEPVLWDSSSLVPFFASPAMGVHMPSAFDAEISDGRFAAVFAGAEAQDYTPDNENREIFLALRSFDSFTVSQLTDEEDVSYWPDLLPRGSGGLVAWSSLAADDAETMRWQLRLTRSADLQSWSDPIEVETEWAAWRPTLVEGGEGPVMAWVETDGSHHRVQIAAVDPDTLEVASPVTLVETEDTIDGIRLATESVGSILATWHRSGAGDTHHLDLFRVSTDLGTVQAL